MNLLNQVEDEPIIETGKACFYTAILTYPSDYDGLLSVGTITEFLEEKFRKYKDIKIVIAREDADEKVQRNHFHIYLDNPKQLQLSPKKFFDINLPEVIIILKREDGTREYKLKCDLESQLGWDNGEEMFGRLASYCKENGFEDWEEVDYAHPNLQIKKYSTKYWMLRYVLKQNLVARSNFDIMEELDYLEKNQKEVEEGFEKMEKGKKLKSNCTNLFQTLLEEAKKSKAIAARKFKRSKNSEKEKLEEEFKENLRIWLIEERLTITEVYQKINTNTSYWSIYSGNYLNYNRLIQDLAKCQPPSKPRVDWNIKFYLPKKLYNYIEWLDDWVAKWHCIKDKSKLPNRPRGLVLIGPSRIGKTKLMTTIGDFTYLCNMWRMDSWETNTAFTIMDDMDPPSDSDKGLNFAWYKGFFGAQDTLVMTDKYRTKKQLDNGKPLIFINNHNLDHLFKNQDDREYVEKNMEIIYLKNSLFEDPGEWIEGHSDVIEFDPKSTWYYQNIVRPKEEEERDELEPLDQRKRRLSCQNEEEVRQEAETIINEIQLSKERFEKDQGRPIKKSRKNY